MKQTQTIEDKIEICELKKQAAMLLIREPEKAIKEFPYCINECEGYYLSCPNYVPQVKYTS